MRLSLSAPLLASGLILCFTSSHGDWASPHPLQQEKAAPVPLIPFPSQVDLIFINEGWKGVNLG